jgi:hypothetical protein
MVGKGGTTSFLTSEITRPDAGQSQDSHDKHQSFDPLSFVFYTVDKSLQLKLVLDFFHIYAFESG